MSQQKIIRHAATPDRGLKLSNGHHVSVTIEDVITVIGSLDKDQWTTRDVADALKVRERCVRATIRILRARKLIREIDDAKVIRFTAYSRKEYRARLYEICLPGGPVDFKALNRAFGYV